MNPHDYDAVEIHRCVECVDAGMNRYVEQVDENDEMLEEAVGHPFWSVYLHHAPGRSHKTGIECVADCASRQHAELIESALQRWLAAVM